MEEMAGNSLPFGSVMTTARCAADLIATLRNSRRLTYREIISNANKVLMRYNDMEAITGADFDEVKYITRQLYRVFTVTDVHETAAALNALLAEFASVPRLSGHGGVWHMTVDSDDHALWAERFATSSTLAFAILLAEKGRNPCGLCASSSCRRPYIDLGKGGGRNYCSPRCATRERVAAYRQRIA